jgi:(2Fe-2S) ferredoxin
MTRIQSMQDLHQAKAEAAEQQRADEAQTSYHIRIGLGSCGMAAGAGETLKAINHILASQNLSGIRLTPTGCIGLCALEPILQVQAPNQHLVTYGKVNPQMARRIMREHILNGTIVHEYVVENI